MPWEVTTKILETPSIGLKVSEIRLGAPKWALDLMKYLTTSELPNERLEARKVKNKAA